MVIYYYDFVLSDHIYILACSINTIFHDQRRSRSSSDRRKHRDSDWSEDSVSPPKMKNDKHRNSEKNGHPRERSDYNDDKHKEIRKYRTYSSSPERNTKKHNYNNSSERRPHIVQQRSRSRSPKRNSSRRKSRSRSPRKKQEDHRTFENHSNEGRYRKKTEEDRRHSDKRHRSRTPSPSARKHDSKMRSYARKKSPPETNVSRFVLISQQC